MKLEVGMYVRTKDGVIGKLKNSNYVGYNNEQIKSIVTKEQFESMEYSLEVCYERKSKKCSYIQ